MRLSPPWLVVVALMSLAQSGSSASPGIAVEDQLDLVQLDRRVFLIDARGQRQRELELEIGEEVVGLDTRGLVAVVRTTSRILGTTTEISGWQELRYRVRERQNLPDRVYLGDRVALVALPNRLMGLSTTSASWQEFPIGAREVWGSIFTGTNVAIVLTNRRAIAFAPGISQFVEITLTPQEAIEDISVRENSATLTTSKRLLIFRVGSGQWTDITRRARGN